MMETFDELHLWGVRVIQSLQASFQNHSELMLFCSHVGDPRNAFLIYFPIAFILCKSVGVRVMWVAVLAEWLNALLKWLLHGERPYWWVQETPLYDKPPPHLEQYRLTCETGPGSPSGHGMVTASVWYVMICAILQHAKQHNYGRWVSVAGWLLFLLVVTIVSISRLYIATHFPHQVIMGVLTGVLLGEACNRLNLEAFSHSRPAYFSFSMLVLLSGPATYWTLELLGFDPLWTISHSKRWCARPEWVHLDTSLFFVLVRDSSSLLGMCWTLHRMDRFTDPKLTGNNSATILAKILAISLSILLTRGQEYIVLPQHVSIVFYSLAYLKYFVLPYAVMYYIPKISSYVFPKRKHS